MAAFFTFAWSLPAPDRTGALGQAILDELESPEQAAARMSARTGMVAEALAEPEPQQSAHVAHCQQIVAPDRVLYGEPRGTGQRYAPCRYGRAERSPRPLAKAS